MIKTALITGGSRGIGLGIAVELAKLGYQLAINGIRPKEEVEATVDMLQNLNGKTIYIQGRIENAADRNSIFHTLQEHFTELDLLVNNAGMAPRVRTDLLEMSEASYDEVLATNLKGPFFLTQSLSQWMIRSKELNPAFNPKIINISSISATVASIQRGEYCISKAGLSMMTQLFSVRLAPMGIAVYEIRPGIIQSDMTAAVKEKYDHLLANGLTLIPRWGQPEDIGKIVAAIATNHFPYTTGQVFMADGGMLIDRL
jgi:3-oxoacyl-[acyl-carrier protein] reductase